MQLVDCLAKSTEGKEGQDELSAGVCEVGIQTQGVLIAAGRRFQTCGLFKGVPEVFVREKVGCTERNGLRKGGRGRIPLAEVILNDTEIIDTCPEV